MSGVRVNAKKVPRKAKRTRRKESPKLSFITRVKILLMYLTVYFHK